MARAAVPVDPTAATPDEAFAALLSGVSADRRELFELRVQRWLPDLRAGLEALYPGPAVDALVGRLLHAAAACYVARPTDLHRLDLERTLAPDWFQRPGMLGYAAYAERLGNDAGAAPGRGATRGLRGVRRQIPYLHELGVTYLHLMPLLRPRPGDNDGGYAVADYRKIRADLGTVADLAALTKALREQGISLVLDLVLNHVAREHEWAAAARAGQQRYRDYFYVYPDREGPDAYERTLPEVFPEFAPGNFTWDDGLDAWVWTTFNGFQWDVNWTNPDVFAEYADIVLWLANLGVEVLRLDAIAFLWKRLGTNCQNQPEVHAIAQALRALIRIACPAMVLKAEAIVAPDDLVHYLGRGRHHGRVSDLAYHNTLMVQVWSMLASRDVRLAVQALRELPKVPTTTAWICYLRCHDDIGWAIDDGDAAAIGLSGPAHRSFLSDYYSGDFPGSFARGLVFQANPATGDRRISGSAASLAGLEAGDPMAVPRLLLAHAIVLGWGGIPVLWMGDELGLLSDPDWADEPGHGGDNRWAHRPWVGPAAQAARTEPDSPAARLFAGVAHLAAVRAGLPLLHAATQSEVLHPDDPGVLPVLRSHPEGELLELFNVTEHWRQFPAHRIGDYGLLPALDVLSGEFVVADQRGMIWLAPYQARWLVAAPPSS